MTRAGRHGRGWRPSMSRLCERDAFLEGSPLGGELVLFSIPGSTPWTGLALLPRSGWGLMFFGCRKISHNSNHNTSRAIPSGRPKHITTLSSSLLLLCLRLASSTTIEPRARHQPRGENRRVSQELRRASTTRKRESRRSG